MLTTYVPGPPHYPCLNVYRKVTIKHVKMKVQHIIVNTQLDSTGKQYYFIANLPLAAYYNPDSRYVTSSNK